MTTVAAEEQTGSTGRFTPALLLLFVGSGCAALVYEVIWFHLLRLAIGTSAISISVLLGSFMGGMCLGSLLFPRFVSPKFHPLKVYAYLELGIGAIGILLTFLLPLAGDLYISHGGSGFTGFTLRGIVCVICLLPPTILMGATLPAIARWMETTQTGVARMGFFYGANIAGAVLGTLLAGFYLLPVYDILVATYVALGINILVAGIALFLATRQRYENRFEAESVASTAVEKKSKLVYTAIAFSGFTALGAEVIWTRLLSLLLGASVYAFSLILAVFLLGLGIGSSIGSYLSRRAANPRQLLAICQLLLGLAIVYGSVMITHVIPYGQPYIVFMEDVRKILPLMYGYDFLRCSIAMLPATILWGASFPLALAAANPQSGDPGKLLGGVYAANTIGAIGGALLVGLIMIGSQGTLWSQQSMAAIALLFGLALFASVLLTPRKSSARRKPASRFLLIPLPAWVLFITLGSIWAIANLPPPQKGLTAYGRMVSNWQYESEFIFEAEGINASVAVSEMENGVRNFHVSGKVVASTELIDMRLQRMLGHLPSLLHKAPETVLIVGCGAGVTAGCFVEYPSVKRIVICEIEPMVPVGAGGYFAMENRRVLEDPRTEVILDDARHFLATTEEKFDVITSDPIHPWVRGAAALYSIEYYDLVKEHLNPGGIVTQWVPLYEASEEAVKSQVGTFLQAFPNGSIWNSDAEEFGYDVVMLGQMEPLQIDLDELAVNMRENQRVWNSLAEVNLGSVLNFMLTYAGRGEDLQAWLADAQINYDRSLRLQYLAGLALDVYEEVEIYQAMVSNRQWPEGMFTAESEWLVDGLRAAFVK
ncbi:MAG: fused MFS/spermidine synthase [Planctomycetota bacterium]|jgi:spermidine synthase